MRYTITLYGDETGFTVEYFGVNYDPEYGTETDIKEIHVDSLNDIKPTPGEMSGGKE